MNFSNSDLLALSVDLPDLDTQRAIADFLDEETVRLDRLRRLYLDSAVALALRGRAFRDGLVNRLYKQLGSVPLRRSIVRLEQGSSPQCFNYARDGDEWAVLKLGAVRNGNFLTGENKVLPPEVSPEPKLEVRDGDLLVARANTPDLVGDAAVVRNPGRRLLLPDLLYRISLQPATSADYVAQVILSGKIRGLVRAVARGSSQSMVKLRGEDIKAWPIPPAEAAEQERFVVAVADQIDQLASLRALINQQIDLLAERRQALITAAVTGQIDVSTSSGVRI